VHLQAAAIGQAGASIVTTEYFVNDQYVGSDTTEPYGLSLGGLQPGLHHLQVRATDSNGASTLSAPVEMTVQRSEPEAILLEVGGASYLGLVHHHHPLITNRTRRIFRSPDLLEWQEITPSETSIEMGIIRRTTLRDPSALAPNDRSRFLQLRMERTMVPGQP
jgi:hypothetical protein